MERVSRGAALAALLLIASAMSLTPPARAAPLVVEVLPGITMQSAPPGGNNSSVPSPSPPPPGGFLDPTPTFFYRMDGILGTLVFFASSPNATSWTWDFGDGFEAFTQNATHTFSFTGFSKTYIVTLTACVNQLCDVTSQTVTVVNWGLVAVSGLMASVVIALVVKAALSGPKSKGTKAYRLGGKIVLTTRLPKAKMLRAKPVRQRFRVIRK